MDEYSFISENGNVRQIRDLIAKEKDEQQDNRLNSLESVVSNLSLVFLFFTHTAQTFNAGTATRIDITVTKAGYRCVACTMSVNQAGAIFVHQTGVTVNDGSVRAQGAVLNPTAVNERASVKLFLTWQKIISF